MTEQYEWATRVEWNLPEHPGWGTRAVWQNQGPWANEPDLIEWRHAGSGLPCLIVRGGSGALCGYVGLPPTHKYWGRDYDSVRDQEAAHGGLTYANECGGQICHVPRPGETLQVWWLGFDCAHAFDLSPALEVYRRQARRDDPRLAVLVEELGYCDIYRDVAYVKAHVEALATELDAVGPDNETQERWWWPFLAGAKRFVWQDFPRMWREIYLEKSRWGFTSDEMEAFRARM